MVAPSQLRPTVRLTRRESDVLSALMIDGADNRTIGRRCGLSEQTVKTHMAQMFRKTGTTSRAGLVLAAVRGDVEVMRHERF